MLKKASYKQLILLQFLSGIVLICAKLLDYIVPYISGSPTYWAVNIFMFVAFFFYIFATTLFIVNVRSATKVLRDELTTENEAKAVEFTFLVIMLVAVVGMGYTMFSNIDLSLNNDLLFCIFIGICTLKNGAYLVYDRNGGSHADFDDED